MRVPWLADAVEFDAIPRLNQSSTQHSDEQPHEPQSPSIALCGYAQAIHFFGLLKKFLRLPIEESDFVVGSTIDLTQAKARQYFDEWRKRMQSMSSTARTQHIADLLDLLRDAARDGDCIHGSISQPEEVPESY